MTRLLEQVFAPYPPVQGRKMSREEQEAGEREMQKRQKKFLQWIETDIRRLRDHGLGIRLYLELLEQEPQDLSRWEKLREELTDRDEHIGNLFDTLHHMAVLEIPLTQTLWEYDCEWG